MIEGGVETDAPTIVASLGVETAPIIASEGVEAVAPIIAISVLHALSLIFTAIVVPKADTPRTRTFMRIFLYGGMIASGVLGTFQEATDVAYSPLNRALRASLHSASATFFSVGLLLNMLQPHEPWANFRIASSPPASGTPDGSSPRDSPGGSSDGPTEASPRAAPSLVDDASGDGDAAGQ